MEREVGGGIGMGNTCKPLAVSFQCMTKSTTNKKKKKKKELVSSVQISFHLNLPSVVKTFLSSWYKEKNYLMTVLFPGFREGKEK